MTVRVYRSTDASAPTLTGQAGSLTTLLDAILVNGYGSQTAAGWSIGFTTTNKRAYLQNLTGSNNSSGMYLYVDDTAPTTAKEARVCGFETMAAITPTGAGQFPTSAQSTIGTGQLVIRKSTTADATARAWTCVANGQTIYLFTETADSTVPLATCAFVFGDFKSFKTGDQYAVCIIGRTAENSGSSNADPLHMLPGTATAYNNSNTHMGHFVARHWAGSGGSIKVGKIIDSSKWTGTGNVLGGGYFTDTQVTITQGAAIVALGRAATTLAWPYPNGADGAMWVSPIFITHSMAFRGYLLGLWAPLHDRPLGHNDTLTWSAGNLSGKSIVAQNIQAFINGSANGDAGQVVAETSNTWS